MRKIALLLLILVLAVILRFYRLETIPPLIHTSSYLPRLITAIAGLVNVYLTYKLSVLYTGRVKLSLFSAFVMGILPWTLEEGRVYSSVNNSLAILMTGILLLKKFPAKWTKILVAFITIVLFLLVYRDVWVMKNFQLIPVLNFRDNLFRLLSPQMLLINNITFYHGGLREWGMIYISLFPFLIYGMIESLTKINRRLFFLLGILIIAAALSPFFPESREFFLVTPLLSFFIGCGIYKLSACAKVIEKIGICILLLFFLYETSQLLHFYYVHYPLNVLESADKIYEPF